MNKQKEMIEKRKILNKIRHTCLVGNLANRFYAYNSESEEHIKKKFDVWLKLRKNGYTVYCEPIFKENAIRFDLLGYREGIWVGYEILKSEKEKELSIKIQNYPSEVNIISVKTQQDIENLEML